MRGMSLAKILVPVMWVCLATSLPAQDSFDRFWRSYTETGLRGGDVFEANNVNLFLPLYQSEVNMVFADVRGNWTDAKSQHGNFGLAFRQMLIHDWIFGINAAYDTKASRFENNFHQAQLGLEMLHPNWGIHWNGYLAGEGAKPLDGFNGAQLIGNDLFIRQASERAYSGTDVELESRLWSHDGSSDNSWRAWHFHDWELWGSAGFYHFDNDASGFESMTGPRLRMELRIFDIPFAGPDSRLVFAGQYEDDDVRGDVSSAMVTVRIPFGRGTRYDRSRLRGVNRRMVAPIVRNTEIISVAGFGEAEEAAFARTGQNISQVLSLDAADAATMDAQIAGAGADSLVIIDGTAGTISPANGITLQDGQAVMGGGTRLAVRGINSGASAIFTAAGSRPQFDTGANPASAFTMADNSCLLGLNVSNSGGISAIDLNNSVGALIDDVIVNTSGIAAHGIEANGATFFSITDTTISTSGNTANGLEFVDITGNASGLSINTSGDDAEGVHLSTTGANTAFLGLAGTRIFTSGTGGSEGIHAEGNAQLSVNGTTVTATDANGTAGTVGILADPGATGQMAVLVSSSIINSSGNGIELGGAGFTGGTLDATLSQNTILSPTGRDEIRAETNGGTMNLSASGNAMDTLVGTIRLDQIGGTINVQQMAPGTSGGIDSVNGLPSTNVLTPSGAPTFDQPQPTLPTP